MRFLFLRTPLRACLLFLMAVVPVAAPAQAEVPAPALEPISLQQAVDRALRAHPQLAAFPEERRSQAARADLAAQRPAAELELQLEDAGGSGARRGLDAAQTTLALSQVLELGGQRTGRAAVADAAAAQLRSAQAARQLDVLAEVERRYIGVLEWQARLAAAEEAVTLAERSLEAVATRVRAAAAPEAEHARARVAAAEAGLALEDAEHELKTARHALAAAIGAPAPDFGEALGDLYTLAPSRRFEDLITALRQAPDTRRFADEARLRDAELRLAERAARPNLRASLGLRHYAEGEDLGLVAGLGLPLFAGSRAQPGIDLARAERARLDHERDAAFLRAQAQLYTYYEELEHARHVVSVLGQDILPALQQALDQTEYAYRRGRYAYLEWGAAQQQLLDARARRIAAAVDFHTYRIEIERLTGEALVQAGATP